MKILVADANLVPHRERFEAALPAGRRRSCWRAGQDPRRCATSCATPRCTSAAGSPPTMADVAEKLRLIHVAGAGTDRVDFAALPDDVLVANTFHHERSIAEYVLAAAIMLRRDFLAQDRALRHDVWATSVYDDAIAAAAARCADARIGFVGFGHIGQRAWDLFRAFGCTGAAVTGSGRRRRRRARPGVGRRHLAARRAAARIRRRGGLGAADTEHTEGMIGADAAAGARARRRADQRRPRPAGRRARAVRRAARRRHPRAPRSTSGTATRRAAASRRPERSAVRELPNVLMTPHSSGVTARHVHAAAPTTSPPTSAGSRAASRCPTS